MPKKEKEVVDEVGNDESTTCVEPLAYVSADYGREDLNQLGRMVNLLIDRANKG